MTKTFVDLFCGIGGFHEAWHALGARCVLAVDIDPFARTTYLANHAAKCPEDLSRLLHGDIHALKEENIPQADIICAGFPCQSFSQAGHKKGFADANRGNLFFEILRVAKTARPKVLMLENVQHLVKHDGGATFRVIQDEIHKRGYSFVYQVIKASDHGLPQHRPRVYMVCFDKSQVPAWQDFKFPDPIPLEKTMADVFGGTVARTIGLTLRVGGRNSPLNDRHNWDGYLVDGQERRLSPKEGVKMMGFADTFVFPVSNTQAMKQLGNSVAVDVVKRVAQEILKALPKN